MIADQYVWLVWSSAFLAPWLLLYAMFPGYRSAMLWASLFTMPFGLTEPLFVPVYWSPPSLFDLARTTGFDIESLIFCFGIGGVGAVAYNAVTRQNLRPVSRAERNRPRHRFHYWALSAPFLSFIPLYLFPWNPIYPSILAMLIGAGASVLCRPDLTRKVWVGGGLFLVYYGVFLFGLEWTAPGYIERVWNIAELSGLAIFGAPIEELLFAVGFGAYWSSVYEHFTWNATASAA